MFREPPQRSKPEKGAAGEVVKTRCFFYRVVFTGDTALPDATLITLLQQLIAVPSINPSLAHDPALAGEERYGRLLASQLEARGFGITWHTPLPGRPNFIARRGPVRPRRRLLVEAHLDTQGVEGMIVDPFAGVIRDGRLYGRGACDQKGPTAAALHALDAEVLSALHDAGVELLFAGAMGEERGNLGAEQLVDIGLGADEGLVLEPTDLHVVHAHKGAFWFEIEVRGRAAHGSGPEHGVNAIEGMAAALQVVRAQVDQAAAAHHSALLGRPTVNVGVIRGGTSINIVPDRCVVEIDRRTLPGEDHAAVLAFIRDGLAGLQQRGVLTGFDVRMIKDGTPFETAGDSPLVQRLLDSCAACGVTARAEGAAWFSDAGPFSRTCPQIAVFGPGSIRQAHTVDEYIEVASLQQGAEILRDFFLRLALAVAAA
jgi:succinyl-diaminopimelate desuccinylase